MSRRQTSDLSQQTSGVGRPAAPVRRADPPPAPGARTSVRFNSGMGSMFSLFKSASATPDLMRTEVRAPRGTSVAAASFHSRKPRLRPVDCGLWSVVCFFLLPLLLLVPTSAHAAVQMDAAQTNFNHQAIGVATAAGPAGNTATTVLGISPSAGQFQSVLMGSRSFLPKAPDPTNSASANGAAIILTNTAETLKMPFARVGSPFILRATAYAIGSEITPPESTETGGNFADGVTADDYWFPQPADTGDAYWSPHASKVFAVKSGTTVIKWRTRESFTSDPGGDTVQINGVYFKTVEKPYLISSSPVKTAQTIYWNTQPYGGPSINLPSSRIGDVYFAYTDNFPEKVAHTLDDLGTVKTDPASHDADPRLPTSNPDFIRTVWLQSIGPISSIQAQNLEGRIFMEILGDVVGNDGTQDVREHLGFEVLNVIKYPTPTDLTVELGEAIVSTTGDSSLLPQPQDRVSSADFLYEHTVEGFEIPTYYAIKETVNRNDLLVHWLIEGVEGIRWPSEFIRYTAVWPDDVSKYSHYARPLVSTEAEAEATAVPLNSLDIPEIAYQDVFDDLAAHLTGDARFYTFLTADHPTHRTLLRYSSADNVAFERVFSWLDSELLVSDSASGDDTINTALVPDGSLVRHVESGASAISSGFAFNSQAFTIEARVRLETRGDFDRLMQLDVRKSDGSLATVELGLNISSAQPYPYIDVYGEDLGDPETANLNGDSSSGGLRYRADIMPVNAGHTDLTDWQSINIGSSSDSVAVNGSPAHYGVLFRGNGGIEVWDGNINVTDTFSTDDIFYASDGDHAGTFHRIDILATGGDGNPFDGTGNSVFDVYSSISSSPLHNYEKTEPGYADNYFNATTIGDGDVKNLRVTRISDGAAFAVGTTAIPLETSVHVAMVGDGDRCRIYLDGVLVGEGPNLVGVSGTVETVSLGSDGAGSTTDAAFESVRIWENDSQSNLPRVVKGTVEVGKRILAPVGESGSVSGEDYLAGYINQTNGTSFNVNAYVDPLNADNGLDDANLGAIIPVNAIPGDNILEVWWLRPNSADTAKGFHTTYWPSTIGRYTIVWPENPPEIILASNDGSGPLDSLPATGSIYYQNDSTLPGYNPNEEHAIMSGGQAFALRDDLNITETQNVKAGNPVSYSSEPYVLLEYTESDGRPAMIAFKVLREKREAGIEFSFAVEAGKILQGPMPLVLMGAPIPVDFVATAPSLNNEVSAAFVKSAAEDVNVTGATNVLTRIITETSHGLVAYSEPAGLQDVNNRTDRRRIFITQTPAADEYVGLLYAFEKAGGIDADNPYPYVELSNQPARVRFAFADSLDDGEVSNIATGSEVVLVDPTAATHFILSVAAVTANYVDLNVPTDYLSQYFEEVDTEVDTGIGNTSSGETTLYRRYDFDSDLLAAIQMLVPESRGTEDFDGWRSGYNSLITLPSAFESDQEHYSGFTIQDRKGDLWVYRGPHSTDTTDAFAIRYHYPTLDGFWFPELATQPAVGTLTPYLRVPEGSGFAGDPDKITDESDPQSSQALSIIYRPVWPDDVPELHMAETLTLAKRRLSAIQGNSSLEIIYDQALVDTPDLGVSAVLHDATREKEYELGTTNTVDGTGLVLDEIPASVATTTYNGDTFFPNLPPHLVERFFFDPNRGTGGALVLRGEFVEETVGEDYLHLNTLSTNDIATLKDQTVEEDEDKAAWDAAIDALIARVELFVENPAVPGTLIVGDATDVAIGNLVEIPDDDIAVDSYALTATGPGTGYVSLIAGNGLAFTPTDDPVTVMIVKVVDTLHQGEIKVIQGSNPLGEKLTLQQVVDLAAKTDDYEFDWRSAAPVDGLAPEVFTYEGAALLAAGGSWVHLPHPLQADTSGGLDSVAAGRLESVTLGTLIPIGTFAYSAAVANGDAYDITTGANHLLVAENRVTLTDTNGFTVDYLLSDAAGVTSLTIAQAAGQTVDENFELSFTGENAAVLGEGRENNQPQSYLATEFTTSVSATYAELWVSLNLDAKLGAKVRINGEEVVVAGVNAIDSTVADSVPAAPASVVADDVLGAAYVISSSILKSGTLSSDGSTLTHKVVVEVFASGEVQPGQALACDAAIHAVEYVDLVDSSVWLTGKLAVDGTRAIIGGKADVAALSDQHVIMRYRPTDTSHASFVDYDGDGTNDVWSEWTEPQLAEGWIKRVLAGINPFNQRTSDLFNNAVVTDSSMLTLAGTRWEGDVALNSDTINDYGLIEIYETVLNRGKGLSIDSGINYGPANDALLLAAGYINDLYMFLGNEALSDALNPTIGIGTANGELGDIATALFSFKGQTATLLEEELALLRGRDDFLPPGVEATPVYNRLFWNYTRGIDSGEVVYALNYNIQEEEGELLDGFVGADDAAQLYPQGHGDAYGHFLTGVKNYYALIIDEDFDWVPRTEGVLILNQTVQVDYTDERKFAAAAAAVARTGKQVFDLTWRQDYQSGDDVGWEHFGPDAIRENDKRLTTRYWGVDHWASRTGQGAFINWIAGNAMLPETDDDPEHEGIQVIDRTTVPELTEIADISRDLQTSMDNADAHLNPLGMSERSMAFDMNPTTYSFWQGGNSSHFEQIYGRAKAALNNAVVAFDDAKDVTRMMRGDLNGLSELEDLVVNQEFAYTNALIELYGTPYADDIGVGKTYDTGYVGPDLTHYKYIDINELDFGDVLNPESVREFTLSSNAVSVSFYSASDIDLERSAGLIAGADQSFTFTLGTHGFFSKPSDWSGKRESPGQIQLAISDIVKARNAAFGALQEHDVLKYRLEREADMALSRLNVREYEIAREGLISSIRAAQGTIEAAYQSADSKLEHLYESLTTIVTANQGVIPDTQIFGLATGGDLWSNVKAALAFGGVGQQRSIRSVQNILLVAWLAEHLGNEVAISGIQFDQLIPEQLKHQKKEWLHEVDLALRDLQRSGTTVNAALQEMSDSQARYAALVAKGDRLQAEREIYRKQLAAQIQGFRTRDAGFRFFRDEKLERYNTLFDLAARYAFLAAQAYDYETGLLGTDEGKSFIDRIVGARALGAFKDGEPQFAGSNTGDPGLSSTLAEMAADFSVLKGRLGLNNPDVYGTTVSLRTENFRIFPGSDGDTNWRDVLEAARKSNLLEDEDVVRHCLQINNGTGLQVPGLVIEFSTQITEGNNLFGQLLAGGDHAYDISSFATKIFSVGIVLEGYNGMDNPAANTSATGGSSTADPSAVFLEPTALSATPYVYLIPVGVDAMRSPPLGDQSVIRTWSVDDVTIPLPFNIGASDFSSKVLYQAADSLPEDLFSVRKHQAFRPVSDSSVFFENGQLLPSEYTNTRLIGRSVWNTKWKLVIPGRTLLNDPEQGLNILMDTLTDIKLHFETYSYSGN